MFEIISIAKLVGVIVVGYAALTITDKNTIESIRKTK